MPHHNPARKVTKECGSRTYIVSPSHLDVGIRFRASESPVSRIVIETVTGN